MSKGFLVTGSSRGLGRSIAEAVLEAGHQLVGTARNPGQLDDLVAKYGDRVRAVALDVTDPEPLPRDHPLAALDNCTIVPHVGSATSATRGRMAAMAAANLLAGVRGERLPTPVNPEVYARDR